MTTPATPPSTTRLSIDDAARALGVSRPTIRRRLRSGGLRGIQVTTPHGLKWLVEVTTPLAAAAGESAGTHGESGDQPAGDQAPTAREVELLQAHVDDLRR